MVMALVIVALLIYLLHITKSPQTQLQVKNIKPILISALLLTLVQIVLGTQVRQYVDEQIDIVGETAKNLWLQHPTLPFYIHRSFSILVVLLNGYIWWILRNSRINLPQANWVMGLIGLEVLTGILMYYIDFPFGSQPAHLVLGSLLFGFQFSLVLEALSSKTKAKTY